MKGQYSLYDYDSTPRACIYSCPRFIGQRVYIRDNLIGTVIKIEPYYTLVSDGRIVWALTSTNYKPVSDK